MAAKKVTRVVKGAKGIWINEGEGFVKKVEGDKIVLTPEQAKSKARYLYTPGEYEGIQKAAKIATEAYEEERADRIKAGQPVEEKKTPKVSKGTDSKES